MKVMAAMHLVELSQLAVCLVSTELPTMPMEATLNHHGNTVYTVLCTDQNGTEDSNLYSALHGMVYIQTVSTQPNVFSPVGKHHQFWGLH